MTSNSTFLGRIRQFVLTHPAATADDVARLEGLAQFHELLERTAAMVATFEQEKKL